MDMMDEVGIKSDRHFWQRRCDVGVVERKEGGAVGGEEDGEVVDVVDVDVVELWRRRKGRLGKR